MGHDRRRRLEFDGLILDTELPVFRAWTEAFQDVGLPPLSVRRLAALA